MPERLDRNYHSISDMDQDGANVSWKKFFVHLAGNTTGAHHAGVKKLKAVGQIEVSTLDECDYILLFCPIVSRVGTDVSEALENMPAGKRVIMVVMHHTFNRELVLAESRRLVDNPNVCLVVDSLFHEGKFLDCKRNDIALYEIQKFVGVSSSPVSLWDWVYNRMMNRMVCLLIVFGLLVVALVVILVVVFGG